MVERYCNPDQEIVEEARLPLPLEGSQSLNCLLEGLLIDNKELAKAPSKFDDKLGLENWYNQAAAFRANQIANLVRPPDAISKKKHGCVVWTEVSPMFNLKTEEYYTRFMISDMISEVHHVPVNHLDYFAITIKMDLNPKTASKLHKISRSISYNALTKELTATCHFPGASIASFALIKRYTMGNIDLWEARMGYERAIPKLAEEWEKYMKSGNLKDAHLHAVLEKFILSN